MSRPNKVKKLRLALMDDQTHDVIWVLRSHKALFIFEIIIGLVLLCAIIFSLVAFTPLRTLIPGYPDANSRKATIQTALKVDSLQNVVSRWELYSGNLLRIVEGQEPLMIDSLVSLAAKPEYTDEQLAQMHRQDSLLRAMVIEEEQFQQSRLVKHSSIESMHFFTPLKGAVSGAFEAVTHPYLEITAPDNSPVMSVLEGTVISTLWTDAEGYEIFVQHSGELVSIYRHAQKILVRKGDRLTAGAPIALVGQSGSLSRERFQFELWYKGEAVDPSKYIKF